MPVHDDCILFELLILEGAQAGLSWATILKKREAYRRAFHAFEPAKVARYTDSDRARLLADAGIVRNRAKIDAAISNAQVVLEIQREAGSLDAYLWGFAGGKPVRHRFRRLSDIPAKTEQAEGMSKDLRKRGFKFAGPTICYAFMQAAGMVNDHVMSCYRYREV